MSEKFIKTKPSLMEAGLPCSSLSAECQSDNDARQRPPQNRLHIWWARRPPTVCRVAMVTALIPYDADLECETTSQSVAPVVPESLNELTSKERTRLADYLELLEQVPSTDLPLKHQQLLLMLRVLGDPARHSEQKREAGERGLRLPRAFSQFLARDRDKLIPIDVIRHLRDIWGKYLGLSPGETPVVLDLMAGGGTIPLEALRYGFRVYANDLNPVAALVLKATIEYPAKFGTGLVKRLQTLSREVNDRVCARLTPFFTAEAEAEWWPATEREANTRFKSKQVDTVTAGGQAVTRDYLWCRVFACPKCSLNIPLSTNFHIVSEKGKPEAVIGAFPEVPAHGNDCTFRIVGAAQWKDCRWPRLGNEPWHPRNTPTYSDGHALCPRCGSVIDESDVKKTAQARPGGLPCQMYAVCSQVPVKLTYRDGSTKVRYLWRFRAPTDADRAAVASAEAELKANEGRWASLIPTEGVPFGEQTMKPHYYGFSRWREMFLPRQLLTIVTILEEIKAASAKARAELTPAEAEAVAVYLALIVSKVVNYNSVNTFWDYTRKKLAQSFSRHDFTFRPAFGEFEGARETVMWGASQVIASYTQLAGLIHGEAVSLEGGDDEDVGDADTDDEVEAEENDEEETPVADTPRSPEVHLRPEVIVPTVTNNDAAALETPAPGTVHLICVDPPYYNNIQYAELSNFFYVWLKRALGDWPGLEPFFREELAETNREAVANAVRWKAEAEKEQAEWQTRFETAFAALEGTKGENGRKITKPVRTAKAKEAAGPEPLTASERAERFYEAKMAAVFRRALLQLLHPAGRMVVMFNHKMTKAWRALGKALIEAGFEIRTSIPIHTEAESSLNIRGMDAARSTVLLLCLPRTQSEGVKGNLPIVEGKIKTVARNAASHFQKQGIIGTDLYLSALGPTLGEVAKHWPITDLQGKEVDLGVALDKAYAAVGEFRLEQILGELTEKMVGAVDGFAADAADKNTQALWLWLDTFQGEVADSDDVRKLAKSLDIDPELFKKLKLIESESDLFTLKPPQEVDLVQLARLQSGEKQVRGRAAREGDVWEERKFPGFLGAAVWNALSLMAGGDEMHRGIEPLKRWLRASGHGDMPDFRGAYAVTLFLLEQAFGKRKDDDPWKRATTEARRGWDLVLRDWRG